MADIDIDGNGYRIASASSRDIHLEAEEIDSVRLRGTRCTIIWDHIGENWNVVPDRPLGKPRRMSFDTLSMAVTMARKDHSAKGKGP